MKIAIIGATGMVGNVMLEVLSERNFHFDKLLLAASPKSVGTRIKFGDEEIIVKSLEDILAERPHIAIFSAGGKVSKEWAPKFAKEGTTVIDNSSTFRMDADKKLIVPEINASELTIADKIIANPNCSTIQMVLALSSIQEKYKIKRLVISTYQSVSGTGVKATQQLAAEREGKEATMVYPHPIDLNCLPHGGDFEPDGYTTEETKLVKETAKIFNDATIKVTATVVRVPVLGGHSESVNIETRKPFELELVKQEIAQIAGVTLQDDPRSNLYPMPINAHHKDDVFVGRIRRDTTVDNGLNLWIVADNLRKGAATNAIQIAEYLIAHDLITQ